MNVSNQRADRCRASLCTRLPRHPIFSGAQEIKYLKSPRHSRPFTAVHDSTNWTRLQYGTGYATPRPARRARAAAARARSRVFDRAFEKSVPGEGAKARADESQSTEPPMRLWATI